MDFALCKGVDPALFYPEPYDDARDAKDVCKQCAVQVVCLEYSLATREKHGVWGGMTESSRRRLLRQRAKVRNDTIHS
jgi:WhiB family redox-sensing transcriptional regulator